MAQHLDYSERPDTVAGNLLEGRFAIMVDGTPFSLIAPVTRLVVNGAYDENQSSRT